MYLQYNSSGARKPSVFVAESNVFVRKCFPCHVFVNQTSSKVHQTKNDKMTTIPRPPPFQLQLLAPLHQLAPIRGTDSNTATGRPAPSQVPIPIQLPVPLQLPAPLHQPAPLQVPIPIQLPVPLQHIQVAILAQEGGRVDQVAA